MGFSRYDKDRPFLVVTRLATPPKGARTENKEWYKETGWQVQEEISIVDKVEDLGVNVFLCTYYEKKRGSQFSVSHHLIDCCKDVYYLTKDDFENARLMK